MRFWMLLSLWLVVVICSVAWTQAPKRLSVAFVGVANESSYGSALVKDKVSESFLAALSEHPLFVVKDAQGKVAVPATIDDLRQTGSEFQSLAATQVIVKQVSVKAKRVNNSKATVQASVVLEAQLVPTKGPSILFHTRAEGQGNTPTEESALAQAASAAAKTAVQQLATLIALRGQVLLPPAYAILPATYRKERDELYERTVRISLDMVSGMKVGAEVVILKGGQPVAKGKVVEVDYGSSLVALTEVAPTVRLQSGDEVRVTFLPQTPAKLTLPFQKEREYKRVEHDFALALFLAGVGVAFLGE